MGTATNTAAGRSGPTSLLNSYFNKTKKGTTQGPLLKQLEEALGVTPPSPHRLTVASGELLELNIHISP